MKLTISMIIFSMAFPLAALNMENELKNALKAEKKEKAAENLKIFLNGSVEESKESIRNFADRDLEIIKDTFKNTHSLQDQRIFWLTEEFEMRRADRIAQERLQYLFAGLLVCLILIAALSSFTLLKQFQLKKRLDESA